MIPKLSVLPVAQRALWPELAALKSLGFVLYGGTALALRLGHRESIDFDFFSSLALDIDSLYEAFHRLSNASVLQQSPNTLTVLIQLGEARAEVKLSFFGGLTFGRLENPTLTDDGVALIASERDLLATKLKVLLQRIEAKDYQDIDALLGIGQSLAQGLADARTLFGPAFAAQEALKALTYFQGADFARIDLPTRQRLGAQAKAIGDLPPSHRLSDALVE